MVGFTRSFPPNNCISPAKRQPKDKILPEVDTKDDSAQKRGPRLGSLPGEGVRLRVSVGRAVANTHLQPGLDGAVPLRLSAPVLPEPLQFLGAVKNPRSPFQSGSSRQLLGLLCFWPLLVWRQSQGLMSTTKPLLAGQEGPLRPEAGSWPPADFQAHPDVGSRTARQQAGPSARGHPPPPRCHRRGPGLSQWLWQREGCPEELSPSPPAGAVPQAEPTSPSLPPNTTLGCLRWGLMAPGKPSAGLRLRQ